MGTRLSKVLGNSRHIVGNELVLLRLLGMGRRHASLDMLRRRRPVAPVEQREKADFKGMVDGAATGRR